MRPRASRVRNTSALSGPSTRAYGSSASVRSNAILGCRWPADGLFESINQRIKAQIEKVEDMTGDMDPKTNFALIVIQTELERYKYIVRSYLRARIAKVSRLHSAYSTTTPSALRFVINPPSAQC